MNYFLDLFSPATWNAFCRSGGEVTGFRSSQQRIANEHVRQGDVLLCYLTRLSRWCGALRVESDMYLDSQPIFADPDPFTVRFNVAPIVVLQPEYAIPIHDDSVWPSLSITKSFDKSRSTWTGFFRNSLNKFNVMDGEYLLNLIKRQQELKHFYTLSKRDVRYLETPQVPTPSGMVEVEIPVDDSDELPTGNKGVVVGRDDSINVQAKVAQIGAEMGFRIWVPRNDKQRVQERLPRSMHDQFLSKLPLNYDDTTLKTIEQIDILWLKGRSIARAFEIEHTTAIYSGLLRMADLLALQPNMDIRLHIVAAEERRDQVLGQIKRPVFSLLERGPLYKQCTYLSYGSINELEKTPNLPHIKDTIIDEYEESADT